MNENKKGLNYIDHDSRCGVALDPDNVFWGIVPKGEDDSVKLSREILSLYEGVKDNLDKEMKEFRFGAELSAVYVDPTSRCNADCPYCYIPRDTRRSGDQMETEQLLHVLGKIETYFSKLDRRPVIIFHASEPLLVKEAVFEGIKRYSDKLSFGLQTNATLLTKEDVAFLKKYNVGVGISLDSYKPETNNKLRRSVGTGGNFKSAVRAIEWFEGYDGLNVITTVNKYNVRHLPQIVKFLHAKKVGCVLLNPVRLTQKNSRSLKPDVKLMAEYFLKAVDTALELTQKTGRRIIIGNFSNVVLGIVAPEARRLMCDISPCGGGRCFFTITASGEMIPCGEFIGIKGFSGGNIFKTGIENAMNSAPFKKIRSRFVEKIEECSSCVYRNICGAPCPAELHSMGNMFKKAVFCEFYKEIIKYAFDLIAKGKEKLLFREQALGNLKYEYFLK